MMILWLASLVGAYLVGSISSAVLICKAMGLPDPRTQGSGNPGATNVLRFGGKVPAALTLAADILKGFLPVLIVRYFSSDYLLISSVLFAALLGHVYPVFFRFKGGKAVATLIGGLAALSPLLCGIFLLTWLVVFIPTRLSSLSALTATGTMPIWAWFYVDKRAFPVLLIVAAFVFWRHRSNIRFLLEGKEDKSTF